MKFDPSKSHVLSIPMTRDDGRMDFFIILGRNNIARLLQYDPLELPLSRLPDDVPIDKIDKIFVAYASEKEMKDLMAAGEKSTKEVAEQLQNLFRGWKFRSEMGDCDVIEHFQVRKHEPKKGATDESGGN